MINHAIIHQANINRYSLESSILKVSRYLYSSIVSNFKLETANALQVDFRITSSISFLHAIATITYPRLPKVCLEYPGTSQSNSNNSSGYEKTLCDKNLQITELQLYINNIKKCLGIVDLLSSIIQDYQ